MLLDAQYQGTIFLKKQFKEDGDLLVLKQDDAQFVNLIELAIEMGKVVIVEQAGDQLSLNLQSILRKDLTIYGGQQMIQFSRKHYKYDSTFKLFVVCNLLAPHFVEKITNKVTFLNFTLSPESLTAQLLTLIVRNERGDLESQLNEYSKEAYDQIVSMKGIEHALLSQLDKTNLENLLTQDDLLRTLNESKSTAETVSAQLKNIQVATELLSRVRAVYLPIAQRASCLYFVLQDMQKINSMYQFSMLQFKDIFTRSLELSNVARVEHPHSKDEEEHYASLKSKKMMTIPDRIDLLIQAITQETYRRISYSIYQEDRKLVLYLMAIRIM